MSGPVNARPNKRQLEKRLATEMELAFQGLGMSKGHARKLARQILDSAKHEAKRMGQEADLYREGDGDSLVERAKSSPEMQRLLERLSRQGVTNEDFRQWHNLSLLEKLCLREQDNAAVAGLFLDRQDQGMSSGDAAETVKAQVPLYTWNIDDIDDANPHAKLPVELKARVNGYQLRRFATDPEGLQEDIERAGSFNAHVREQIARDAL